MASLLDWPLKDFPQNPLSETQVDGIGCWNHSGEDVPGRSIFKIKKISRLVTKTFNINNLFIIHF